jgi:hypothetical protein
MARMDETGDFAQVIAETARKLSCEWDEETRSWKN